MVIPQLKINKDFLITSVNTMEQDIILYEVSIVDGELRDSHLVELFGDKEKFLSDLKSTDSQDTANINITYEKTWEETETPNIFATGKYPSNELYPSEVNSESVAKYIVKVRELEGKIKELERLLEDAKRENGILQSDLDKSSSKVDTLTEDISSVREELRSKKDYVKELEESLSQTSSGVDKVKARRIIERIKQDMDSLESFIQQFTASQSRTFDFQMHLMITADTKEELENKKLNLKL